MCKCINRFCDLVSNPDHYHDMYWNNSNKVPHPERDEKFAIASKKIHYQAAAIFSGFIATACVLPGMPPLLIVVSAIAFSAFTFFAIKCIQAANEFDVALKANPNLNPLALQRAS